MLPITPVSLNVLAKVIYTTVCFLRWHIRNAITHAYGIIFKKEIEIQQHASFLHYPNGLTFGTLIYNSIPQLFCSYEFFQFWLKKTNILNFFRLSLNLSPPRVLKLDGSGFNSNQHALLCKLQYQNFEFCLDYWYNRKFKILAKNHA